MKTRFSPSPTGQMHLGNVRTALFSYLLARKHQGHFLLRVEDSDKARSKTEFTELLKTDLNWLGLNWDEGPYYQSERTEIYQKYYQRLEEQELVYPCFCSDEQLALSRKIQLSAGQPPRYQGTCRQLSVDKMAEKKAQGLKPTLRFKVPLQQEIVFEDLVKGKQVFRSQDIGDFIIRRGDGSASFFFCNAIDDALMGVTHAMRGEDHLTNTPRQLLILNALKLTPPKYGHLPLILSEEGESKLSKREGSQSLEYLRALGYLPLSIMNYLARLGHYYEQPEFMGLSELIERFSVEHIGNTPAHFDQDQLLHWQKQAVMALETKAFWAWVSEKIDDAVLSMIPQGLQESVIALIRPNVVFPDEFSRWVKILFQPIEFDAEAKMILHQAGKEYAKHFAQAVEQKGADYGAVTRLMTESGGFKGKALFQPMRIILTGQLHGPELQGVFSLLGKEGLLEKIRQAQ